MQAFLCPLREGAVHERGVDEELDAVVKAVDGERRRSELQNAQFKFGRKPVAHLGR